MGRNNFYQIGLPDISNYKKPTLVETLKDKHFIQVACGQDHCIVLAGIIREQEHKHKQKTTVKHSSRKRKRERENLL
jgi:hypothetical protein